MDFLADFLDFLFLASSMREIDLSGLLHNRRRVGWGAIETSDSGGDACLRHEMINRLRMFMHLGNLTRAIRAMYCNKMLQIFRVKWS